MKKQSEDNIVQFDKEAHDAEDLKAKIALANATIAEEIQIGQTFEKAVEEKKHAVGELDYVMVNNQMH